MTELEVKEVLQAVQDNMADHVKVSASLNSLANYSRDPQSTAFAIRNDAIKHLLSTVRAHDGEPNIHLLVWTAIGNFCVHSPEAREQLKTEKGIETILKSAGLLESPPSVEGSALTLANIAADKAAAKQILENDGVTWLVARLGREPGEDPERDARLDRALVTTVANLCINDPPAATSAVEGNAIPAVLKTLDRHSARVEIVDSCWAALRMLTFATCDIVAKFTEAGVFTRLLDAMKTHTASTGVATYGLALLQRLKLTPEQANAEFFESLGSVLKHHEANADSARMGIAAIAQVVRGQAAVTAVAVETGAIDVIVAALNAHSGDAGLAGAALAALANISMGSAQARTALVTANGIDAALTAMNASPQQQQVQENGSLLLGNLGFDPTAKEQLVEKGAVKTLMNILTNLSGQWTSVRVGLAALANLLAKCDPAREAVCAEDNLTTLVKSISPYTDQVELLLVGFSALTQLTVHSREACGNIVKAGIFPVICTGIAKHSGHQRLVKLALQIIQNIAFESDNSTAFIDAGGATALATALATHPADPAVQNHGCSSVSNVAQTPSTVPALIKAGLLPLVLAALVAHKNDDGVQRAAMAAVARLSAHDASHDGSAGDNSKTSPEALSNLLDVLAAKKDNADVQSVGLAALSNVNVDLEDPAIVKMMKEKGLKAIKDAMEAHPNNAKIQENGCLAISNLCDSPEIAADPVAKELVPVVVKAMKTHEDNAGVVRAGNAALATLMGANPDLADTVREAGGIGQICDGMRKHKDNEGVQETGCLALQNAATNDENNKAIADAGGIELVVDALNNYPENDSIQKSAATALGQMAATPEVAKQIAEKGGVDALVAAAERANDNTLGAACTALEALHASGVDEVQQALERTKAAEKVEAALAKSNSDSAKDAAQAFLKRVRADTSKKEEDEAAAKEALARRMREAKGRVGKLIAFFESWGGVEEGNDKGKPFKVQSHRGASSTENKNFLSAPAV